MKTKKLAILTCVMLILVVGVGATLAWLMDESKTVTNTFSPSTIGITLTETNATADGEGNATKEFKMVPGDMIAKDPLVTVEAGSEPCWLFVEVTKSANFDAYLTYEVRNGWTELGDAYPGVYYKAVAASEKDQPFYVLEGTAGYENGYVTVKSNVTKTMMEAIDGVGTDGKPVDNETVPSLTFKAYAIQQAHFDTAVAAWTEINK